LIISKKNEVYLNVETDKGIARELSDFFTFEVPGAKFMPQYRSRMWDGKIRLFSMQTGEIYFGLLSYIEEFAKRNEIEIEYKEGVKMEIQSNPMLYENLFKELDQELEELIYRFVTTSLMQYFMRLEMIGVFFLVLLLRANH